MTASGLEVLVTQRHGVATFTLVGPLELGTAHLLTQRGEAALEVGRAHLLLIDLTAVSFLDSSGLQALEGLRVAAHARLGYLVLVRGSPAVQRVLELSGLLERFQFLDRPTVGTGL